VQVLHIGFVGEAGVGGHDRAGLIPGHVSPAATL
jgi:hypothetical protein